MAQKVITELVCDLTGEPAEETLIFGIDNRMYQVDLTAHHASLLRETLEDYVKVARPMAPVASDSPARVRRQGGSVPARADREQSRAIREWARRQGRSISDRGRIPAAVVAEFERAHQGQQLAAVG